MSGNPVCNKRGSPPESVADISDPPPLDTAKPPPVDRYCDLVLTGGVTDGVIYPWAILELAREYRFKNIGGTSVGAMAAALTAAAEYGRRRGSFTGFNEVLRKLPRKLGEDVNGHPRLFTLFQPAAASSDRRSTQRLFDLFVPLFSPVTESQSFFDRRVLPFLSKFTPQVGGSIVQGLRKIIPGLLKTYGGQIIAGIVIGVLACATLLLLWCGITSPNTVSGLTWLPLAILGLLIAVPWAFAVAIVLLLRSLYLDLTQGLVPNGFGLCTGYRTKRTPASEVSLIEWLYDGIQLAAGKPHDKPLTFRDLWEAPGGPSPASKSGGQVGKPRSIDLQMVTTNLTHGRPYSLPVDDTTSQLYFRPDELQEFFPPTIIDHLKKVAAHDKNFDDGTPLPNGVLKLPKGELPVIVAARLSLSFPFLFSRVPLWAIDFEKDDTGKTLGKCAFSDGGICSNFPIHLFDAAVPEWPTFGIHLSRRTQLAAKPNWPHRMHDKPPTLKEEGPSVWLPQHHNEGHHDQWDRFADDVNAPERFHVLIEFIKAIFLTAKDWNDRSTVRMPGVRDRVARVFLEDSQAGLNLNLTDVEILTLAKRYGTKSGRTLIEKFVGPKSKEIPAQGWDEHRWVRFNIFLAGLRKLVGDLRASSELAGYTTPLRDQIAKTQFSYPLNEVPPGKPLAYEQTRNLQALLDALIDLEAKFDQAAIPQPYGPAPQPALHLRPPP